MIFPNRNWIIFLALLISVQFAAHYNKNSPYLYYTKGLFTLENPQFKDNMYGMAFGPNGEIIHFDAVKYWAVQNLFAGKYRGDHLGTIKRPVYNYLVSMFSNYFHHIYISWAINLLIWLAACLFSYNIAIKMCDMNKHFSAKLFSALVASAPAYVNIANQPMSYVFGYSIFIMFVSYCLIFEQNDKSAFSGYFGLVFLLLIANFTYEILGPMCIGFATLFLIKKKNILKIAGLWMIWIFSNIAYNQIVLKWILSYKNKYTVDIAGAGIQNVIRISLESLEPILKTLIYLGYGYFLSCLFLIPFISLFGFLKFNKKHWKFWICCMVSVSAPLFYMGIHSNTVDMFNFYKSGRVVAYYMLPVYFGAVLGTSILWDRIKSTNSKNLALGIVIACSFLYSNLDIFGVKYLYHLFNFRQGY